MVRGSVKGCAVVREMVLSPPRRPVVSICAWLLPSQHPCLPPCMLRRQPLPVCLGWGPTAIPRPVLPDSSLALPPLLTLELESRQVGSGLALVG